MPEFSSPQTSRKAL